MLTESQACDVVVYLRSSAPSHVNRFRQLVRSLPEFRFIGVYGGLPEWAMAELDQAARLGNVTLRQIDFDFGKGAALRAGIAESSAALIALVDIEGEVNPKDIRRLCAEMAADRKVSGVIGNRWAHSALSGASWRRRLSSSAFSFFANALFGLRITDVQSPIKVFRSDDLFAIFEHLRLLNAGFDTELLYHARKGGLALRESAMDWRASTQLFPFLLTGLHAGLALVILRVLEWRLPGLRFLTWLGHRYIIPVKSRYKILIFSWRDPMHPSAGGGEAYLYEQARLWVAAGHDVTWVAQRVTSQPADASMQGIRVVRRGRVPSIFWAAAWWYLSASPRDYDFLLDCMNGIPFFSPLFSTKPKVCLVHHLHSPHFREELPWPLSSIAAAVETKLVPLVYRRVPFITVSDSTRSEMEKHRMSRLPIKLVHNGVSASLVPGEKAPVPTVLYLGRLRKYKRVRKLIDAFVQVKTEVPNARLVIAGTGDDEGDLRAYVRERAIPDVEFTGRVDDVEKVRLMQAAWVFGMPSSTEGWGVVVIEANACRTPAIAYNVGGLRDCIKHEETGFLAASDVDFADHLTSLLSDSGLRNDMSDRAQDWAQFFSWQRSADITLEQIRNAQPWSAVFEGTRAAGWRLHLGDRQRTPSH